jgi:hypothetical protein
VIAVPDHPSVPAADAWGVRSAIVGHCADASDVGGGRKVAGTGCVDSSDCLSGICHSGNCAVPCAHNRDCNGDRCADVRVTRSVPGGTKIEDRALVCVGN